MTVVAIAEQIAREAHAGAVDKQGRPYIEHCERVAMRMVWGDDKAVAWLHDVVEDTEWTCEDLEAKGIPMGVVVAVAHITHHHNEQRSAYYERVKANPVALRVKLADIADNTDPRRLLGLPVLTMARLMKKYGDALDALQGPLSEGLDSSA